MTLGKPRPLVLAGIALALGAVVLFSVDDAPEQPATPRRGTPRQRSRAAEPSIPVAGLHLERLQRGDTDALPPATRDPFRFRPKPAPPPPPRPAPTLRPDPVAAPPVPTGPPPPPPIALKFIGLVNAPGQGGRVAVLSDSRGSVFYGKEGDIIDGRYRVLKINPESAELAYVDGRGRQVIRLSGQ
jgi:hypothetical protein